MSRALTYKAQHSFKPKPRVLGYLLHALSYMNIFIYSQSAYAGDISYHSPLPQKNRDNTEPAHTARVVAEYDLTATNENPAANKPSPDAIFQAYKKAVVEGEADVYERFYTKALLKKTKAQTAELSKRQVKNLKHWNQKLMSCRNDTLVSAVIIGKKATNTYKLTDSCNKASTTHYQRVKFKLTSKQDDTDKSSWKIDRITFSPKNDFDSDGHLKFQLNIM